MGWMKQLYDTYENIKDNKKLLDRCSMPLVIPSHTVQTAHVEIVLDEEGDFLRADTINKDKALTALPCTQDSSCRGSNIAPHMLYDKLMYVAGDSINYGADDKVKSNFEAYCEQLKEWTEDVQCPEEIKCIYKYIMKKSVIQDLIDEAILSYESGKLKWNAATDNKPAGDIFGTFVRFAIENSDMEYIKYHENKEFMEAYRQFDRKNRNQKGLCFITGKDTWLTYKHPSKIRYSGDRAKLISANDTSGFTFRGRFNKPEEAFGVDYDISQKAHSALRWLIRNQGFGTGDQTVVAWAVSGREILQPMGDTAEIDKNEVHDQYTTKYVFAEKVKKAIYGYRKNLTDESNKNIVLLIVEAATPGRLSITYYREFLDADYFDNIEQWHTTCVWNHSYKNEYIESDQETGKKNKISKRMKFTGAPSVYDIIEAVYGEKVDTKQKKHLVEILISCITDRKRLPKEFICKAVMRFSNPCSMKEYELEKLTSIACALIKKYYYDKYKEEYDMSLDTENRDRSYLFGRVLAYAENIESYALFKNGDKRVPNARKYRSKFRIQPAKTLMLIDDKLEPYVQRLYVKHGWMYEEMQKVIALINENDFMNNKPLEPTYILGYSCQMAEFMKYKNNINNKESEESEEE